MIEMSDFKQKFAELFQAEPVVYRAPGRVNLIGEHTDYNDGFVMPAAIDFSTWVAIAKRDDRKLVIHSDSFSETVEFDLDEAHPQPRRHWSDYPRGVAVMLMKAGYSLPGANLLIHGEVPLGSGLSSSAAIEVSTGFALLELSGHEIDRRKLALLCQSAENNFVGMRCGIMDQFISCHGTADHALMLDCRSLDYQLLPLPVNARLVICNTMVKHELASGEYNVRRSECETGVKHLSQFLPHVRALRDVAIEELEQFKSGLSEVVYRRCHHVISENERVVSAASALKHSALATFGRLMNESHQSLRDDYEVSCAELDLMVELAHKVEGVYGARMTGGGFGGCTVNLVNVKFVDKFQQFVAHQYEQATGINPEIYVCTAAQGAERMND